MKSGQAVYLHTNPRIRGNISRVTREGIFVTWHKYVDDVPEILTENLRVNLRDAGQRMRVFYPTREHKNIGVGVPE